VFFCSTIVFGAKSRVLEKTGKGKQVDKCRQAAKDVQQAA